MFPHRATLGGTKLTVLLVPPPPGPFNWTEARVRQGVGGVGTPGPDAPLTGTPSASGARNASLTHDLAKLASVFPVDSSFPELFLLRPEHSSAPRAPPAGVPGPAARSTALLPREDVADLHPVMDAPGGAWSPAGGPGGGHKIVRGDRRMFSGEDAPPDSWLALASTSNPAPATSTATSAASPTPATTHTSHAPSAPISTTATSAGSHTPRATSAPIPTPTPSSPAGPTQNHSAIASTSLSPTTSTRGSRTDHGSIRETESTTRPVATSTVSVSAPKVVSPKVATPLLASFQTTPRRANTKVAASLLAASKASPSTAVLKIASLKLPAHKVAAAMVAAPKVAAPKATALKVASQSTTTGPSTALDVDQCIKSGGTPLFGRDAAETRALVEDTVKQVRDHTFSVESLLLVGKHIGVWNGNTKH